MENNEIGNQVGFAAQHEGLQVVVTAEADSNDGGGQMVVAVTNGSAEGGVTEKRRRGRPRKQQLGLGEEVRVVVEENPPQKRGRGRPRGSGKWQTLATSLGLNGGEIGGSKFTPYIIEIQAGENIVQRILSFSQMTCDSICILSASGTVSSAEIDSCGGILRYQGEYNIIRLNGSHIYDERKGDKNRLMSVQLADSKGRFFGGAVAASLIAAGPTQIIVGTFKHKLRAETSIAAHEAENGGVSLSETAPPQPSSADWDSLQPTSNV